jgi:hypothetical protein
MRPIRFLPASYKLLYFKDLIFEDLRFEDSKIQKFTMPASFIA